MGKEIETEINKNKKKGQTKKTEISRQINQI